MTAGEEKQKQNAEIRNSQHTHIQTVTGINKAAGFEPACPSVFYQNTKGVFSAKLRFASVFPDSQGEIQYEF